MRRGLALFALLTAVAAPAVAQAPALSVTLRSRTPEVRLTHVLTDGKFVSLMRSGLPLRLHYRVELWRVRSGWFDQFGRDVQWDAVARHDPLAEDFVLIRANGATSRHATAEELALALEVPYRIPLVAPDPGRYYFVCRLEVATLNDTDLAELDQWLRGEVGPAVTGGGGVGDALARGLQRVMVRIAGLPRLTLEARSPAFRAEAR